MDLSTYYVALSGLQKSVRRGLREPAHKLARIAWEIDNYRLYARLWVILFEDCGRDLAAIKVFSEFHGNYKNWQDLEPLIETLVNARKSHDAVGLSWIVTKTVAFMPENMPRLDYENHPQFWLVETCKKAARHMREKLCQGCPSLHWDTPEILGIEDETQEDRMFGFLPSCSLDKHTRPGRFINNVLWKQLPEAADFGIGREDIGMLLFLNEGSLLNSRVIVEPDYWKMIVGPKKWTRFTAQPCQEWTRTVVIPKAIGVREWALAKVFPDLLPTMERHLEQPRPNHIQGTLF